MSDSACQQNLHGFTVVLYTRGPLTCVGRWDEQIGGQIFLNDVSVHQDGDGGMSCEEFVLRAVKFGPRITHRRFAVAADEVRQVRALGELSKELTGI